MHQEPVQPQLAGHLNHVLYHTMREPLRNLVCVSSLLSEQIKQSNNSTLHDYTDALSSNAERLSGIIQGLLDLINLEQAMLSEQRHCLKSLVKKAWNTLDQTYEPKVNLQFQGTFPQHDVDPHLLSRAFLEILKNAQQATSSETIDVQVCCQETDQDIILTFQNSCGGLSPALINTLTHPFVSINRSREHLGLGLTHVAEIIKRHQGVLTVALQKENEFFVEIKLKK
ncbi:MAG: hypothetical protein C0582_03895 [Alphaproteobacteria bacterium]|nr:MAG: hypothetical protein C0582_03895 [Alphaproteobacteria bacterium]